jgi:hypothetical protein
VDLDRGIREQRRRTRNRPRHHRPHLNWSTVQVTVLASGRGLIRRGGARMARMAMKDRREELIVAAIRVMTRDGVVRTTTRAVVSEAGMTLGVFHTGEHPP